MQTISPSQASAEVPINENFATLSHQAVYGLKQPTTTGLTWGYWGGRWGGFSIADGTVTLTASATNYLVVAIATGVLSASTSTTNWNDTANYLRVYSIVTGTTGVTGTPADYRAGPGGVGSGGAGGAYTLPAATASIRGGITVGAGLAIAGDVLSATGGAPATQALTDFANATGTTTGLTYGYQAGVIRSDNVPTAVVAGTVALTASTTNYVEVTGAGVVSANTVGFTSGRYPLCTVLTGVSTITTITDKRGLISVSAGVSLGAVNVFTKNQSVSPSALTSGATIAVDASLSNNFKLTLAVNATLSNPTNSTDGMIVTIRIKQDATGSRTLAYGSAYKFPGGAPVLSTAANAVDLISMYYDSTDAVWECVMSKGFA